MHTTITWVKSLKLSALCLSLILISHTSGLVKTDMAQAGQAEQAEQASEPQAVAETEDEYGETNPEELSMKYYIKNMNRNLARGHDFVCSLGYLATKSGAHDDAVKIFKTCAQHGNQGSKIWMSYMHQNGFGVKKDASESTRWVKESADEGYSIGKYNYGLALLKGYGVKRDPIAGKAIIDEVAAEGDIHAKDLKASNYNPDSVTPDADQEDNQPIY